jgi:hypothetical protein
MDAIIEQQISDPFKVVCEISKAYKHYDLVSGEAPKMRLIGMASGVKKDREGERMAHSVIDQFQRTISEGIILDDGSWSLVPLISAHRKNGLGEPEWDQILGHIIKAWIDEEWNLWIEAELDPLNPAAVMLFQKLTRQPEDGKPVKLGLSIGGRVQDASHEYDPMTGEEIYTYRSIAMNEVTVTSAPAYPTEYMHALSKSVNWEKVKKENIQMENITENITETAVEDIDAAPEVEVDKTESVVDEVSEDVTKEQAESADASEATEADADVAKDVEEAVEEADAEIEKAETVEAAPEVEYVTVTDFEVLRSAIESLTEQFGRIEKSLTPVDEAIEEVEADVEAADEVADPQDVEAEEVVVEDEVERSVEPTVDVEALVNKAIESMIGRMGEVLNKAVDPLKARIEELENEEVDKSISVTRASDVTKKFLNEDRQTSFADELQSVRGEDAIRKAFGQ